MRRLSVVGKLIGVGPIGTTHVRLATVFGTLYLLAGCQGGQAPDRSIELSSRSLNATPRIGVPVARNM
jgi:hypothetical protein